MSTKSNSATKLSSKIPADNLQRNLVMQNPENKKALHVGVVGDTYTILLSGTDTAGQFCLIDMHVPPGGGLCGAAIWRGFGQGSRGPGRSLNLFLEQVGYFQDLANPLDFALRLPPAPAVKGLKH